MKKFVVLSCLLASTSLYADPTVHDIEDVSVRSFNTRLNQLVKEYGAENMVWISDIHGVQTRDGNPGETAEPRGDMPNIARTFVERGGHFIAASADKNFMQVLDNLRQLDLLGAAGVKKMPKKAPGLKTRKLPKHEDADSSFMTSTQGSLSLNTTGVLINGVLQDDGGVIAERAAAEREEQRTTEFKVVRTGQVVSVRAKESRDSWFRAKYMAPEFARGHGKLITKPVFIFTEDSGHNIDLFRKGMKGTNWYHLTQHVYTFQFDSPEGDLYDEDFIEPGQAPVRPAAVNLDSDDDSSSASDSDYETTKETPEIEEKVEYVDLDSSSGDKGVSFATAGQWPQKSLLETTVGLGGSGFLSTGLIPIGTALDSDDESSDDTPGNPLAQSRWVPTDEVETFNIDSDED